MRHYWASLDELAIKQGIGRNMLHKTLKKELGVKSITDLPIEDLSDIAWTLEAEAKS